MFLLVLFSLAVQVKIGKFDQCRVFTFYPPSDLFRLLFFVLVDVADVRQLIKMLQNGAVRVALRVDHDGCLVPLCGDLCLDGERVLGKRCF